MTYFIILLWPHLHPESGDPLLPFDRKKLLDPLYHYTELVAIQTVVIFHSQGMLNFLFQLKKKCFDVHWLT